MRKIDKWYIWHYIDGCVFIDLYDGETSKDAIAGFRKKCTWSDRTKILTARRYTPTTKLSNISKYKPH